MSEQWLAQAIDPARTGQTQHYYHHKGLAIHYTCTPCRRQQRELPDARRHLLNEIVREATRLPSAGANLPGGIVLVHGGGAHADWWTPFAAQLAEQGFEVVALSNSGNG